MKAAEADTNGKERDKVGDVQVEAEQINKAEVEHCQSQSKWSGKQAGAKQCTKVGGQARVKP